jgi:hypothetical protein
VFGVRVRLQNVLALDVKALEGAIDRGIEHVRNTQPRLLVEPHAPIFLEELPRLIERDVPIPRQLVRE